MLSNKKIWTLVVLAAFAAAFILTGCSNGGNANATTNDNDTEIEDFTKEEIFSEVNPNRDYLILVNKNNPYEFGGNYDSTLQNDLVYSYDFSERRVEKGAYHAFSLLCQKLKDNYNLELGVLDGYRDAEIQQGYYNQALSIDPNQQYESEAGYSEHHTGLSITIGISDGNGGWRTFDKYDDVYQIICNNLADFGFIYRYPEDKTNITGLTDHWNIIRFVGSAEVAHEIMDRGLCLEEYLGVN